jgi:hypothetical protein
VRHEVEEIVRAVRRAGGEVTLTRNGHVRISGPAGVTVIPGTPGGNRSRRNALAKIRSMAGIDLREGRP